MSPSRTLLIGRRVALQLARDRRTVALIFVVPTIVVILLGYVLRGGSGTITLLVTAESPNDAAFGEAVAAAFARAAADEKLRIRPVTQDEGRAMLRKGDAAGMVVLTANGGLRLVLEGTRPEITAMLTRLASQAAVMRSILAGDSPVSAPPSPVEREFVRAGPELDIVDGFAPTFIAFFAYFFVFLLTSVAFLRERAQGTLERLMVTPVGRVEILAGYMLGLGVFALLQSFVVVGVAVLALRIHFYGNIVWVFLGVALLTLGAVNLGIVTSTFARNEFQAVQFMPVVVIPQALLSEAFFPLDGMPEWVRLLSRVFPLTYAVDVVKGVMVSGRGIEDRVIWTGMLALVAFAVAFLLAGAQTLRRRIV